MAKAARAVRIRSSRPTLAIVAALRRRGAGFKSLHEALDTTTPGGRLVFHVFAALAEFIRELIVEGTPAGLDATRGRGVHLGRPPAMLPAMPGLRRCTGCHAIWRGPNSFR